MSRNRNPNQSLLDEEPYFSVVKKLIEDGETNSTIVEALFAGSGECPKIRSSSDSIRRFRKRHHINVESRASKSGVRIDGDDAEVTSAVNPYPHMDDPDKMLEERGLDPQQWLLDGATINEWDGPSQDGVVTYHQAKLRLKRKHPEFQIFAARTDGWKAPPKITRSIKEPELVVVVGDQQVPFHDEKLHYLFCCWLDVHKPHRGVSLGDKVDFPEISKYRLDPENTATVQECIDKGYSVFRDYVDASDQTRWSVLPGNHDERIRNIVLDRVPSIYEIGRAATEETPKDPVLTLPHLLRLDELDIEYVDPKGAYDLAQINLTKKLAVRHGWIARAGSGASALATLDHLGYSVIVGHTHRMSIVYKTKHEIDGTIQTLTAAEAGCMCRVDQTTGTDGRRWPNFAPSPDWQQGFSTVTIHPNGFFRIDNAIYVNEAILWRDQCYTI